MAQLLISWIYVLTHFFIWGMCIKKTVYKISKVDLNGLDLLMVLGGAMLTTYAQVFSLFYKVGLLANLVLIIIDIFFIWYAQKDIVDLFDQVKNTRYIGVLEGKRWREIGIYICWGSFVIMPFLIRNYLISGWLVNPYSAIDIFNVDWKLAASTLDSDAYNIMIWGKNMQNSGIADPTIQQWFPVWFAEK